jgi:TATA-box binding protein (TBP) (component of TFIID and TFIIIB)
VFKTMEAAWVEMKRNISLANRTNKTEAEVADFQAELKESIDSVVALCRVERKRKREMATLVDISDEAICRAASFTDDLPLANYCGILHLVPRLVNVVTLAEAVPVHGSGTTLPLDLLAIGSRCTNAYYAPKRFAAVQLAFSNPRCRVLIFHTGRFVGTGCSGPMAARMAILKAARQIALQANVHLHIRKFNVINQVGAVSIDATLSCDAFASTHSATSHYDRASFVGLAWRPGGESICCEIYSTGKANLPGSTRQRDLLNSFSRMVPELLRHSNRTDVCELIPDHLRRFHRPKEVTRDDAPLVAHSKANAPIRVTVDDLFGADQEWALGPLNAVSVDELHMSDDEDMLELAGF